MKTKIFPSVILIVVMLGTIASAQTHPLVKQAQRIVFLGDSITNAGHFISLVEAQLHLVGEGTGA